MAHRHLAVFTIALASCLALAAAEPSWAPDEKPIAEQLGRLRNVPDSQRGGVTRRLALEIRRLPAANNKVRLAYALANLSTEGDFLILQLRASPFGLPRALNAARALASG